MTRSLDPNIVLEIEEREDRADKLLAEWDHKNGGKEGKRGVSRFVVAKDAEGKPLDYGGLTRQQFQQAAIQEQRDLAKAMSGSDDELVDIERDRPQGGYDPAEYGDGVTAPE